MPAAVVAQPGVVFTRVVAGYNSTLLIDTTGAVWVCGTGAFKAAVGAHVDTPTPLPGLAGGHGAVVGAAISGDGFEAALVLFSDGTVVGCGHDRDFWGVLGRLPGAAVPEDPNETVAPTPLPALHR